MSHTVYGAQFSDSHLYQCGNTLHHGANVYQNLRHVLMALSAIKPLDFIVFTGDLTQDHSAASYQLFVQAFQDINIEVPVYFVAGNHDEHERLNRYLVGAPFNQNKWFSVHNWQFCLLNSKHSTPSGWVVPEQMTRLSIKDQNHAFMFMHHHPIDVGYFIDRHGLLNKTAFWQTIAEIDGIRGIACGHVHNGLKLNATVNNQAMAVYTCPATSIQFDKQANTVKAASIKAGFRLFEFKDNGQINSQTLFV